MAMQEPASAPPTPGDIGDDAIVFQQNQEQEAPGIPYFMVIISMLSVWTLILIVALLGSIAARKARAYEDTQIEERELGLVDRTTRSTKLNPEEMARRTQKRRDAYLDTFQRNQVQLVSRFQRLEEDASLCSGIRCSLASRRHVSLL